MAKNHKCLSKVSYASQQIAQERATAMWNRYQQFPYKCQYCHQWHLTKHKYKRMERLFELVELDLKSRKRI